MASNSKTDVWNSDFDNYQKILSVNIKRLRRLSNMSQEKLGLLASVDRTLVSKIERCIGNPSLEVLTKIAFCLDISIVELFKE